MINGQSVSSALCIISFLLSAKEIGKDWKPKSELVQNSKTRISSFWVSVIKGWAWLYRQP